MTRSITQNQYDNCVKEFLSQKIILAYILVHSVSEFRGFSPYDVIPLIEGTPEVSTRKVDSYGANLADFVTESDAVNDRIYGMNTESASMREGKVYYDIKFYVLTPSKSRRLKLIIDIEAQNRYSLPYKIETRGVYYCARMISEQKEVVFSGSDYQDIKKVYSIWICTNCPEKVRNTMTEYSVQRKNLIGDAPDEGGYDLLSVIVIGLSDKIANENDNLKLHRLLETFFSDDLRSDEKKCIIEQEYGIKLTEKMERSVNTMCNVSDGLIEKGIERGADMVLEMLRDIREKRIVSVDELVDLGYKKEIAERVLEMHE